MMIQGDLLRDSILSPIDVARSKPDIFPEEFVEWLKDNIHVWNYFVSEARKIIARGFKHYSSRTIIHVMRHHSAITEASGEWKINNNHSPYLARLFDAMYPESAGLWEYRTTKKPNHNEKD